MAPRGADLARRLGRPARWPGPRSRSPGRRASGPTLGSILTAASVSDTVAEGGILLLFYSLGLAVPFLLTAIAFTRATAAFRWLRDRYLIITAVSGVVLITMGVLLFTGELTQLNIEAQQALDSVGLNIFGEL